MNRYTNFILTVIAVLLFGILFKDQIVSPVLASWHMSEGVHWSHGEEALEMLTHIINMLERHI